MKALPKPSQRCRCRHLNGWRCTKRAGHKGPHHFIRRGDHALLAEKTAAETSRREQQAAEAALPALGDLSGGERTLLRRALVVYAQQWMAAKVGHTKAGDRYNAEYDQQRIDACDRLSERLRLGSVPPSAPAAAQELDPFVELQRLRSTSGSKATVVAEVASSKLRALAELYRGVLEQDGWETLELTVRDEHPKDADAIFAILKGDR